MLRPPPGPIASLALALACAGTALAAEEPPALPEELVCFSTVFEPFVTETDEAGVGGVDAELVVEAGRRVGIPIRLALMPWARLEAAIREGAPGVRCAFSYFRTADREQWMDFTGVPLHTTRYVFFVRTEDAAAIGAPHGILGRTLAVNRGFTLPEPLRVAVENDAIEVAAVQQEEQSFRMLELDRVDAVLTDRTVGEHVVARLGIEGVVSLEPISVSPAFLVFSRSAGLGWLVPRFDEALREMEEDGTSANIRKSWSRRGAARNGSRAGATAEPADEPTPDG